MDVKRKVVLNDEAKKLATLRRTTYAASSNFDRELAYVKSLLKDNGVAITNISTYYVISKLFSEPDPQSWKLLELYKTPKDTMFKRIIDMIEASDDMSIVDMCK